MDQQPDREDTSHDVVKIEMNGKPFSVHRGHQTISQLKVECHVDPTYVIEQIGEGGQLTLLPDDGGSGTTLVVAERLGRKAIGIDQNPAAVSIASSRIA